MLNRKFKKKEQKIIKPFNDYKIFLHFNRTTDKRFIQKVTGKKLVCYIYDFGSLTNGNTDKMFTE